MFLWAGAWQAETPRWLHEKSFSFKHSHENCNQLQPCEWDSLTVQRAFSVKTITAFLKQTSDHDSGMKGENPNVTFLVISMNLWFVFPAKPCCPLDQDRGMA